MNMFDRRATSRLQVAGILSVIVALPMMMGAEDDETTSGCLLAQETLKSPVQAVTTILEYPDGHVEADLALVSTNGGESRWVDTASEVELRIPNGDIVMLSPAEKGHYRLSSEDDDRLLYMPGETYRLTFELEDSAAAGDVSGGEFIAVVEAPSGDVDFEISEEPEFVNDTAEVRWSPGALNGLLEIYGPQGELVYTSFDWSHPEFDGSKWGSLIWGGRETINVDFFDEAGPYEFRFCGVQSQEGFDEELSGELGVASGFMAGRCVDPITIEVPE